MGLGDRIGHNIAQLSGGQRRRALIARAFVNEPDLVILDEPTAGVDVSNQALLADVLRGLVDRGYTLVTITHELGPLRPALDRVVTLEAGRIAHDEEGLRHG